MADDGTYILTGISFVDNPSEDITVQITDLATDRTTTETVTTDGSGAITGISIAELLPLMDHVYQMLFYGESGEEVTAYIAGDPACCVEFTSRPGVVDSDFAISVETCTTA